MICYHYSFRVLVIPLVFVLFLFSSLVMILAIDFLLSGYLIGVDIEEPCEACDDEKQRAAIAISNILSVLTHHSEVTGRLVCERRCSVPRVGILCSSLNTSLNRIKQSFVL